MIPRLAGDTPLPLGLQLAQPHPIGLLEGQLDPCALADGVEEGGHPLRAVGVDHVVDQAPCLGVEEPHVLGPARDGAHGTQGKQPITVGGG